MKICIYDSKLYNNLIDGGCSKVDAADKSKYGVSMYEYALRIGKFLADFVHIHTCCTGL